MPPTITPIDPNDPNAQFIADFIRSRPIAPAGSQNAADPSAPSVAAPASPDADLQTLVQRMIDGGESEADIANVIQHYRGASPRIGSDVSQPGQGQKNYTVTDPVSGKTATITGATAPTEADLDQIFAQVRGESAPAAPPQGSAVGRFVSNLAGQLNPITLLEGAAHAIAHPIDTASALVDAQVNEGKKAIAEAKAGNKIEAMGHAAASILPVLGPAAANAGEQIGSGDVSGGLGKATGLLAPFAAGAVIPSAVKVPGPLAPSIAETADAVALADKAGLPLDAATASGNRFVKAAQHLADRTLGGSLVAGKAADSQARGLATLGDQLAAKGYALPQSLEDAGTAVRSGVQTQVTGNADLANDAYSLLRQHEANPANARAITLPDGSRQLIPLPVSMADAKTALQPLYDNLTRQAQLTPASMLGDKATALRALDSIVNGPDHAPLSVVDSALSDLKSFTRTNPGELRTAGQGAVLQAQNALDSAVKTTAQNAGPDVLSALQEGRKATVAKYQAQGVLDSLNAEPVRALQGLIAPGDANIGRLRAVANQAPDVIPQIGRAHLDTLMAMDPRPALTAWSKMGAATKSTLYQDPGYVGDLDSFFRLRSMAADNPNPSGTAHTLATWEQGKMLITAPWLSAPIQLGGAAVSGLLRSRLGVQLLTKGFRIPLGNKAAGTAWLSDLANAANLPGRSGSQGQDAGSGQPALAAR